MNWLVGAYSLRWDALLSLKAAGGVWSCPNLTCQTLLPPHGSPYSLGGLDGGWAGGSEVGGEKEGWEGELRLECKM